MGFVIFMVMGVYLLISLGVVTWAVRHAKKSGLSVRKWGWGAALVMYLIPFWDWIPTVAVHQYYCATESGFWVYKTLDQWKAENPGVMETLVANKGAPSTTDGDMVNYTDTYFLNQRINKVVNKTGPFLINRWRWVQEVVDGKNSEVLARYVNFSTGNGNIGGEPELRFWLHSDGCASGRAHPQHKFYEYENQLTGRKQ
jgi:hypothetical protein